MNNLIVNKLFRQFEAIYCYTSCSQLHFKVIFESKNLKKNNYLVIGGTFLSLNFHNFI